VELLIGHRQWLWRSDFGDIALNRAQHVFTGQPLVGVDFAAAVVALRAGVLPCSPSEREILLIAASIAEGIPVDLRTALECLDAGDIGLIVLALTDAAGHDSTSQASAGTSW
jgi:hypothetical protein